MSSLLYSEEVARLRQTQHCPCGGCPQVTPAGGCSSCSTDTASLLSPCSAVPAAPPPSSVQRLHRGHAGQITAPASRRNMPSQSFENILITFQQSSPCSDSSWASLSALPVWTQTVPPQPISTLFVVNTVFLSILL